MMIWEFPRSKEMEHIIGKLEDVIEKTSDYFDDELTAHLRITKAWLEDAKTTIRTHEFQRVSLARQIAKLAGSHLLYQEKKR